MAAKHRSLWVEAKQKSALLRKSFEQLANSFAKLSVSETDVITGWNIAEVEINAWKNLLHETLSPTEKAAASLRQRALEHAEILDAELSKAIRDAGCTLYGDTGFFVV